MDVKPRTIDNLGIESSVRYAKDMEILDKRLIDESRFIPQKTEVSVAKAYVLSEFDQLYAPGKTMLWANFAPPPNYFSILKPLFSYQLIPSLGGYEKQESDIEKLTSLEDVLHKPYSRKKEGGSDQEQQREHDEEERERQVLVALLQTIGKLDRTLSLINSRRNQYQRG